ncbi:Actin-like protein arp9 (SWI/SNF complex component arp9) [Knufia obscura]|uniref:Actin-like protein arp9 (SWI/SNF complex component arp9) n=1 Tax=Knufia obscura TaxID=1635080 RepID=A0ABR0RDX3_9EURO|nr:Actin-like protein arp9 (SWI/SNF complex component arp9) [Knufia obscura]
MPPFKDEHVLIIAPGSAITQTQLGLPETFTPPRWRFPTRMFPGLKDDEWEPVFVREKVKIKAQTNGNSNGDTKDVDMTDASAQPPQTNGDTTEQKMESLPSDSTGAVQPIEPQPDTTVGDDEETEYYDDPFTAANAVYPIKSGRIENWPCFFALLSHIYQMISPPFHMPVLVVSQPCWTARDKETITQYFFENWKIPALCVMDSALASAWGFGVQSAVVVDVGLDKCDVTAVTDYVVNEVGRGVAIEGCGGSAMTTRLQEELEKQRENYKEIEDLAELAEQVKRSSICEILPIGTALPGQAAESARPQNPLVAASTGMESKESSGPTSNQTTNTNGEGANEEDENDGVLDVAAIVAQNNAAELVAKREREKAEKEAKKKGGAEPAKAARLRNVEKHKVTFTFEDYQPLDAEAMNGTVPQSRKRKREIEVGPERFMAATPSAGHTDSVLDRIAGAVHSTIMAVPDVSARSSLWDNLIVLGNGSRVRGFTSGLVEVLTTRYTLSPSNATIFTSELPSNFSTPVPTGGTNTPIPGQSSNPQHHVGSGVNPLLVAATKNMMQPSGQPPQHLQVPGQPPQQQLHGGFMGSGAMEQSYHQSYRGTSQSPTSMKIVKTPDYFPEWKDPSVAGMEEASFLGAQVAAKVVFIVDQGIRAESTNDLPTPDDERRRTSRAASRLSWADEAEEYETAAGHNGTTSQRQDTDAAPASGPNLRNAPPLAVDTRDRKIAQLHGRLMELETMVYAAGGKPVSHEMMSGLSNPMGPGGSRERNPFSDKYALADHEKVLLRGKSFKTQYFGPSNSFAILLQFEDLSKFVKDIILTLPTFANAKRSIAKIRDQEKEAARRQYDTSIGSLVNMVPERHFADRLLHQYLDTIETTYRIIHVPTFLKDYEAFWRSPKDAKPEFVVQLLVCMSCMYCVVPGGEEGYVGRSSARRETATHWINACTYWADSQSQKHVSLINYQLQVQLWLAKSINCIKVKRYWTDTGALVRRFMAAGLHREPILLCGKINTFDCEMRRRLWYTVLELDLQATVDRGITPTIGPNEWDTTAPRNIDDEVFDLDTEELPEPKPRGTFTRSSFLAWAAENLPQRIELLYKINSIRNTLDHDTIGLYDYKLRGQMDDIPLSGWQANVRDESTSMPATLSTSATSLTNTTSIIAITLSQCMLYEYIVILHQTFACNTHWRAQDFHNRVARRYAAISTIQLYNPQLSVTDTHKQPAIEKRLHLNEVQRRFFSFWREDYIRAALCLSHSYATSTSPSVRPFYLHVADDPRLVLMIETVVNMIEDGVRNLGQGFHGYWITSSALSFVHSKGSPNVPRATFTHAAADRVVKLHSMVMDGQLPRARRMMLSTGQDGYDGEASVGSPASNQGDHDAATQAEAVTSVDGLIGLQQRRDKAISTAGSMAPVDAGVGLMGYGLSAAPGVPDISGGIISFDQMDSMQDNVFGFENMDWGMLMNADPMDFMGGVNGTWDYPS